MWGQYFTLKFKNLTNWEAFKMAIPFAWIDWFFLTIAIDIGHTHKLVTPTQDTFLLIIVQFCLVLIINHFYLKQNVYFSEVVAFVLILIAYSISLFNLVSHALKLPVPKVNKKMFDEQSNKLSYDNKNKIVKINNNQSEIIKESKKEINTSDSEETNK